MSPWEEKLATAFFGAEMPERGIPASSTHVPVACNVRLGHDALFNFQSLLLIVLLTICTCTYVRGVAPGLIDRNKEGFLGLFFKSARLGERLSPYVALACVAMAVTMLVQ